MTNNAKRVGLGDQMRYYYVFSIGTERAHRGKGKHHSILLPSLRDLVIDSELGLARAIMRHYQEKAQAENLPIWLEATTPSSRNLYLSMGFREVEEITLGKGKVNADATFKAGGSGVPLYAMLWWPETPSAAPAPGSGQQTLPN